MLDKWSVLCVGTMNCNSFRLAFCRFSFPHVLQFFFRFALCFVFLCVCFLQFLRRLTISIFSLSSYVPCSIQLVRFSVEMRYREYKMENSYDIFTNYKKTNRTLFACNVFSMRQRVFIAQIKFKRLCFSQPLWIYAGLNAGLGEYFYFCFLLYTLLVMKRVNEALFAVDSKIDWMFQLDIFELLKWFGVGTKRYLASINKSLCHNVVSSTMEYCEILISKLR